MNSERRLQPVSGPSISITSNTASVKIKRGPVGSAPTTDSYTLKEAKVLARMLLEAIEDVK